MKKMPVVLGALLMAVAVQAGAQPPLPQGLFACHVLTADGRDGLVFVQADSLERAAVVAVGSAAFSTGSQRAATATVIECVPRREATFESDAANAMLEGLVL
ncbi:hypothetical protein [Pseudohaliea rubra]|uniref:Uncharacterized protein n=1 Tax=Pseudohaliea rubra DSM 19751 TaxID=1265313 RepID=A0A095VRL4_9GAMM|nr:hypothetical protein [Pseudohaliea rubra]KGE03728.1 hypothetical protein HRUBRA_01665 [Pseudohaliea rubra DSM 19751]